MFIFPFKVVDSLPLINLVKFIFLTNLFFKIAFKEEAIFCYSFYGGDCLSNEETAFLRRRLSPNASGEALGCGASWGRALQRNTHTHTPKRFV